MPQDWALGWAYICPLPKWHRSYIGIGTVICNLQHIQFYINSIIMIIIIIIIIITIIIIARINVSAKDGSFLCLMQMITKAVCNGTSFTIE